MICSIKTLGISGIYGSLVSAESYVSNGMPGFDVVGLPDAAVKEARERVRAAARRSLRQSLSRCRAAPCVYSRYASFLRCSARAAACSSKVAKPA